MPWSKRRDDMHKESVYPSTAASVGKDNLLERHADFHPSVLAILEQVRFPASLKIGEGNQVPHSKATEVKQWTLLYRAPNTTVDEREYDVSRRCSAPTTSSGTPCSIGRRWSRLPVCRRHFSTKEPVRGRERKLYCVAVFCEYSTD
ncbi:hypothetical protein LY76DRAFT_589819 [Colletotrichum caudatum]|nr:hypothetical protein LY76DRAFT_589819 [Colletotrichum caudatum]